MGYLEFIRTNPDYIQMLGDNQGVLALVKNPHLHERSKHIDVYYYFIRDLKKNSKINVKYILTNDIVADRITKPLARVVFDKF